MRRLLKSITVLLMCLLLVPAAAQDASEVTLTMWTHDGL